MKKFSSVMAVFLLFFVCMASAAHATAILPKQVYLADENHKEVTSLYMEAGTETRTLYLMARDYNRDGVVDFNDYDVMTTVTSPDVVTLINVDDEDVAQVSVTVVPSFVAHLGTYPETLGTAVVKALEYQDGEEDDDYIPKYTHFNISLIVGGDTSVTDGSIYAQTPSVSVTSYSHDDAAGGGDGSGSCSVMGLGAVLLLAPLFLARKRK